MKKLVALLLLFCCTNNLFAQLEVQETTKMVDNFTYYLDIPKRFHLKDKLILKNNTNYYIEMASVAICENGKLIPLGSNKDLLPGNNYVIVSYRDNELKQLRNKKIAIRLKGFKPIFDNRKSEFVNVNPDAFHMNALEHRHDLIININNAIF